MSQLLELRAWMLVDDADAGVTSRNIAMSATVNNVHVLGILTPRTADDDDKPAIEPSVCGMRSRWQNALVLTSAFLPSARQETKAWKSLCLGSQ